MKKYGILVLSHLLGIFAAVGLVLAIPALRYTPLVEPMIHDVTPEAVQAMLEKDSDSVVFIDVRSVDAYTRLHAAGSKSQPLHTLYQERHTLPRNDRAKTIVLICSGGSASGVGYSYLQHYGFRNIMRVEGGIENWQAKGMPVDGSDVLE